MGYEQQGLKYIFFDIDVNFLYVYQSYWLWQVTKQIDQTYTRKVVFGYLSGVPLPALDTKQITTWFGFPEH